MTVYAKWTSTETPAEDVSYTITKGLNGSWKKNSGSDYSITVKRDPADDTCFSHFAAVQIDGTTLTSGTDYTAAAGSTVITLKAATLQKLSDGAHTVTVNFDDGRVTTGLTINGASASRGQTQAPKSGDAGHAALWIALLALSVGAITGAFLYGRKIHHLIY